MGDWVSEPPGVMNWFCIKIYRLTHVSATICMGVQMQRVLEPRGDCLIRLGIVYMGWTREIVCFLIWMSCLKLWNWVLTIVVAAFVGALTSLPRWWNPEYNPSSKHWPTIVRCLGPPLWTRAIAADGKVWVYTIVIDSVSKVLLLRWFAFVGF